MDTGADSNDGTITASNLGEALLGQRGEMFEVIAPLAYEHGADPGDLAGAATVTDTAVSRS
jgi:hypothetical protein